MTAGKVWAILKETVSDFSADNAMTQAASLAFYAALSLAPLLIIFLWVTSLLGDGAQQAIVRQIDNVVGAEAAEGIDMIIENAQERPTAGSVAGLIGIGTLIFSASGVFAQLQTAMNTIWDVEPKPVSGLAMAWQWVRKRFLSMGMIFVILFLLGMALVASTALTAVVGSPESVAAGTEGVTAAEAEAAGWFWQVVNTILSLAIFFALFTLMFKYLPDVKIRWGQVLLGAAVTAVLFEIGKHLIGLYLSQSAATGAYGAAGSLVALLIWVYYSTLILFFGAELTQVYAKRTGERIEPSDHAQRETPKDKDVAVG